MKTNFFSFLAVLPFMAFAQYSNGGLSTGATSNSGAAAPSGYTWSELQNNTGNTTESNGSSGYTGAWLSATSYFFIADDFTIPSGQSWQINSIDVFAYQTGYTGTTAPFNTLRINILNGDPSVASSTSVFGDDTTNRFASGSDSNMYRVFNSSVPSPGIAVGTTRKIWKITGNASVNLPAGTYWLKYQLQNVTAASGGFLPSVTIPGTRGLSTFNAKQFSGSTSSWTPIIDPGTPLAAPDYPQDMPFIITYTVLGTNDVQQFDNRVVVYPNPVKDSFKVQLPAESKNSSTTLSLFDMSGKLMTTFSYADSYDSSKLEKGSYILKINDGKNIKVTKLIKQ